VKHLRVIVLWCTIADNLMPLQIPSKALQKRLIINLISENSLLYFLPLCRLTIQSDYEMLMQYLLLSFAHFDVHYSILIVHILMLF
jgi:hypothetical protein